MRAALRAVLSPGNAAPLVRVVPVSATKAFVVAAHESLGAVAYEFMLGNGTDGSTPAVSVGAPFGGWRWVGTAQLASFDSDPAAPLGVIHADVGATGPVMQINDGGANLFGGEYHGGLTVVVDRVDDLSRARVRKGFGFGYDGLIVFGGGGSGAVQYQAAITTAGDLATVVAYRSSSAVFGAYLSMAIASGGYTKYSLDGGVTWADCATVQTYALAGAGDVTLRNPVTGYTIRTTATADRTAGVTRSLARQSNRRTKDYFIASSQGAALGVVTARRTIRFGKTTPDPVYFDYLASRDGLTGTTRSGEAAPTINAGRLYYDRSLTATAWIGRYWDLGVLSPGSYRLTFDYDKTGSGSVGTALTVTTATNGSVTTPTPLVNAVGFTSIGATYDFTVGTTADFDMHIRMTTVAASTDRMAFRSIALSRIG